MKENLYLKKFKDKTKAELEFKINNSTIFEPDAVEAAKHILENYSEYENERFKKNSTPKLEYKSIEKAFFKNKWIYRFALFFTLFTTVFFFWVFTVREDFDLLIWSIINFLFFIVLISMDKKTLPKLKFLSIISLCYLVYRYVIYYLSLEENEAFTFELKDVKFIAVFLFIILGGELMIEIRKVKIPK